MFVLTIFYRFVFSLLISVLHNAAASYCCFTDLILFLCAKICSHSHILYMTKCVRICTCMFLGFDLIADLVMLFGFWLQLRTSIRSSLCLSFFKLFCSATNTSTIIWDKFLIFQSDRPGSKSWKCAMARQSHYQSDTDSCILVLRSLTPER